jgi:hypothetical protein
MDPREPMAREITGRGRVNPWRPSDREPLSPPFADFFQPIPVFQEIAAMASNEKSGKQSNNNTLGACAKRTNRKSDE